MLLWTMSDRAIPRSYRTMEGFGVHTFRLVAADGSTSLVKFHWKPVAGVHSLVWEEAQIAAGADPDFHRRDLALAIENGAFPQWELGLQVFPDTEDETFEGIDLLDPTKIVPEELAPVQPVGRLTLNANPTNYFAETEQVAFHTAHLVPGIETTNDPLLQGRHFSYLDTQLTRLGGPNFSQLPINRPHVPVNDNLRDGFHQSAVHDGLAAYLPTELDPNAPQVDPDGYVQTARPIAGPVVRDTGAAGGDVVSFDDHYTQATLFWASMSDVEQTHIVEAFTFELGKCYEQSIRERALAVLARVDARLCAAVAAGLGLPVPTADREPAEVTPSAALSQLATEPGPIAGRMVGVVASEGSDLAGIAELKGVLEQEGAQLLVIAAHGGVLGGKGAELVIERTFLTVRSIEFDAVVVAGGTETGGDIKVQVLLQEAFRHCKPVLAWGSGVDEVLVAGIDTERPGVLVAETAADGFDPLKQALGLHRVWDRFPEFMLG